MATKSVYTFGAGKAEGKADMKDGRIHNRAWYRNYLLSRL